MGEKEESFLTTELQLINVEGMKEIENHFFGGKSLLKHHNNNFYRQGTSMDAVSVRVLQRNRINKMCVCMSVCVRVYLLQVLFSYTYTCIYIWTNTHI